jgi:transcriptional regulator GlxA family with amidase domain
MARIRIHVLVLRDCTAFVPIGFADMLRKSVALASSLPAVRSRNHLDVTLVSATKERTVPCAGGVRVRCDAVLRDVRRSDLVLVPALDPDIASHLAQNRDVVPWLRRIFLAGADVASACTGSFVLAEAGLLDRKAATTHWAFQEVFRQRYPRVRIEPQAIVVDQGRVVTAGGATSFLSLALYLVERLLGPDVARAASKMFLVDVNKSPQSAYAMFGTQKAHGDEDILRAQGIIEQEVALAPTVEDLARRIAMSKRNFVRRFKGATGNVPREYVQRVRVEAAKRALEGTPRSIAAVARDVGYDDAVAFRKLFVRLTGLTPADYRARYGARTAPALVARQRLV